MKDLIIIGGGPAGLVAGIYGGRKKLDLLILTSKIGGQILLTNNIENFPGFGKISGFELIEKMRAQIEKLKVPLEEGVEVVKIEKEKKAFKVISKNKKEYFAKSLILASGKKPRPLGIPGEKKFEGRGVSYCSICDAPLFKGKKVAVIGGGNAGLESANDLLPFAQKIYLLELGPKILGDQILQEPLKKSQKVEFLTKAKIKEIQGRDFVEKIIYEDLEKKEEKELQVEGVFVNIGQIPSSDFVKGVLELNSQNEIVIDPKTNQTSLEGVFAAGDVTNIKWKQCVIAAGEGAKALLSAVDYLKEKGLLS